MHKNKQSKHHVSRTFPIIGNRAFNISHFSLLNEINIFVMNFHLFPFVENVFFWLGEYFLSIFTHSKKIINRKLFAVTRSRVDVLRSFQRFTHIPTNMFGKLFFLFRHFFFVEKFIYKKKSYDKYLCNFSSSILS